MPKRSGHAESVGQDARRERPATEHGRPLAARQRRKPQVENLCSCESPALRLERLSKRLELCRRLVTHAIKLSAAAIPVPRVARVALDFVEHGVKPVGRGVALVPLGDRMSLVPVAGDREIHAAAKFVGLRHFTRSLNTFRTFATFGAAAAWQ